MINFRTIEIENLDVIVAKCLAIMRPHIVNFTNLYYLDSFNQSNGRTDRFRQIPELMSAMKKLGWDHHWWTSALVVSYNDLPIHYDHGDFKYSLNIPILNTKGTSTVFYKANAPATLKNPFEGQYYYEYDPKDVEEIERVEIIQPTLIKVHTPHTVLLGAGLKPRVVLALRLHDDVPNTLI
jgi:hypothetical protein